MARDDRGNTLLMIACMKGHVELATKLLTHYKTLDPEFDKDERQVWYCNVNARDGKGWNATSVAAFHCHRAVLELVLEHGGDPTARNVYGKNAFWFGQDEWDMGETMVLKDRSEVREVLNRWESSRMRKRATMRRTVLRDSTRHRAASDQQPRALTNTLCRIRLITRPTMTPCCFDS